MSECQACGAKSQLFLCRPHTDELGELFDGLPRLLGFLQDAVLGRTRLGTPQRRHRGDEQPMRYNPKASELYADACNTLTTWLRHVAEQHGIDTPLLNTNAQVCQWMSRHVYAIAADEAAGECLSDIITVSEDIERAINRPEPPRLLGPCITDPVPDEVMQARRDAGERDTRCGRALTAKRTAKEVTCSQCHRTHDIGVVIEQLLNESGAVLLTVRELVDYVLPQLEEIVPIKTLERWIRDGQVPIRGHNARGVIMVQLSDVRNTRARRPRHAKVGR